MIHRTIAGVVLLLALGFLSHSASFGQPPMAPIEDAPAPPIATHSVVLVIDTSKKGEITASGFYSAPAGVTLTKLVVWAHPVEGGIIPPQEAAKKFDHTKKTWSGVTIKDWVYSGGYAVRADGTFSDKAEFSSAVVTQQVASDNITIKPNKLSLSWSTGYPKGGPMKTIEAKGTYGGEPVALKAGEVFVTPIGGGPFKKVICTLDKGSWKCDPAITVGTSGETYQVIVVVGGSDERFYCAPVRSTTPLP